MDKRFPDKDWSQFPFDLMRDNFLTTEKNILDNVATIEDEKKRNEVLYGVRFFLSSINPRNYLALNPTVINKTLESGGFNLYQGYMNYLEDYKNALFNSLPSGEFEVGKNLAITEGKVIFKNELIELIQYKPLTEKVNAEPILFVPAWIMKYYILDLEQSNSMFKWLLEQGHQVFTISWKNPTSEDRDLSMEDYRKAVLTATDVVVKLSVEKIHLVGYCLGGTMAMITAAGMAKENDDRLASITLFAAQVDFTEAGEIRTFLSKNSVAMVELMMNIKGYLDGKQMGISFQLMRPDEMIFGKIVREYFLGERDKINSMAAWNLDTTRMPAKMHSEYLEKLFLNNDLAEGRYLVDGRPINLKDVEVPMFVVGADQDHIAPWKSVIKVCNLVSSESTFCLASGGHNVGIVSHPSNKKASHKIEEKKYEGSWWKTWDRWLDEVNNQKKVFGNYLWMISDAPGKYVLDK